MMRKSENTKRKSKNAKEFGNVKRGGAKPSKKNGGTTSDLAARSSRPDGKFAKGVLLPKSMIALAKNRRGSLKIG